MMPSRVCFGLVSGVARASQSLPRSFHKVSKTCFVKIPLVLEVAPVVNAEGV